MKRYLPFFSTEPVFKTAAKEAVILGRSPQKTGPFKAILKKSIAFAVAFVALNLLFFSSAFAAHRVTGVTYGGQTGTANAGTGTSVTYTITLSETGGSAAVQDNILLTWTSGTPTGVTWNFTSGVKRQLKVDR